MAGRVRQAFDSEALGQYASQHIPEIKIPFDVKQVSVYPYDKFVKEMTMSPNSTDAMGVNSLVLGNPILPTFSPAPTAQNVSCVRSRPGNSSQRPLIE